MLMQRPTLAEQPGIMLAMIDVFLVVFALVVLAKHR
jgi:Tfp pilus assembly protein PilX